MFSAPVAAESDSSLCELTAPFVKGLKTPPIVKHASMSYHPNVKIRSTVYSIEWLSLGEFMRAGVMEFPNHYAHWSIDLENDIVNLLRLRDRHGVRVEDYPASLYCLNSFRQPYSLFPYANGLQPPLLSLEDAAHCWTSLCGRNAGALFITLKRAYASWLIDGVATLRAQGNYIALAQKEEKVFIELGYEQFGATDPPERSFGYYVKQVATRFRLQARRVS
jgi:hypothetical protein